VVYWTAPADNGGSPITQYTVTSDPGGLTATSSGNSVAVTGMNKNISYTFSVTATNSAGTSESSETSLSIKRLLVHPCLEWSCWFWE
tara:strand:- start:278 stop:538 length:261 start_codon:yes stop_codon:yes gene_type:complete